MQKERYSNMELLRVVSMLFVLILHANFLCIHAPSSIDLKEMPVPTFFRCYTEALTIVAVNVFVLISGWFGIHFSYKKLWALVFQVLFFTLGFFIVFLIINPKEAISINNIKGIFLLNSDYWFVKAYIILFVLSPILNTFIEYSNKKAVTSFLLLYFSIHTIYGWLMDASVSHTMNGTTALSFIGLYMLGRYLKLYSPKIVNLSRNVDLFVYVVCALFLCLCNLLMLYRGMNVSIDGRLYSYASPVVIIASVALLLFFSKLSFVNKTINWVAISCFAVYLFHCNGFFFSKYYRKMIESIYESPYSLVGVILYVILIYGIAILLDKVRILLWGFIDRK